MKVPDGGAASARSIDEASFPLLCLAPRIVLEAAVLIQETRVTARVTVRVILGGRGRSLEPEAELVLVGEH